VAIGGSLVGSGSGVEGDACVLAVLLDYVDDGRDVVVAAAAEKRHLVGLAKLLKVHLRKNLVVQL